MMGNLAHAKDECEAGRTMARAGLSVLGWRAGGQLIAPRMRTARFAESSLRPHDLAFHVKLLRGATRELRTPREPIK